MGRGEADELEGEGEGGELLMLGTTEWKVRSPSAASPAAPPAAPPPPPPPL